MAKERAPASGEEGAITGYLAQYEFSAYTLLRLMQDNRLDAISVCDHAAGICDDLVAISHGELLAHQIKSQKHPEPFRLKTVLVTNGLIAEIAKSWSSLRKEYPDKRICIRYVLPGFPSVKDKRDLGGIGNSAQLLSFLADPHIELSKDALLASSWGPFILELVAASKLLEEQFFEMFCQLRIYDQKELNRREIGNLDSYAAKKARQIKQLIPEIVAKRGTKKLWTEQELIDELGWNRVPGLRASHSFPLSKDVQANPVVEEALRRVIDGHRSGYISLIGPPGTGKSTTLQRAIASTPRYGVARYLAFLPDERHGLGRAEAIDFLNDVTFALDKLGFSRPRFVDEEQLRGEFLKQLEEASEVFQSNGQKTLIVIDGLDHIQREESPQHNLLSILPPPNSIPDGVIFILGSQYLELEGLAPSIVQQASAGVRCVEMAPLPKQAIFDMADKAELPEHVERQALYDVSAGHPLVARYYIEKLSETESEEDSNRLLASGEIGTNIEQMYELVLRELDPDDDAKHVLGLLARADNRISPSELASVVNDAAVERVRRQAGFLLSGLRTGNWSIFHNSFRVFLGHETKKRFGREDPSVDAALYSELADIAARANSASDQYWLELRYRSRAGEKQAVKELARPALFRKHLKEFRPGKDVYVDLRLAYGAIDCRDELPTLVQLMMTEKEIDYRLEAISQLDLVDTFLRFDELDFAYEIAIAGGEGTDGSFAVLDELHKVEDLARARSLFEVIEPAEYFFGQGKQSIRNPELEDLYGWIERAHRFRSLEQILEIVAGIPFDDHLQHDPTESLKFVLARGVIHDNPTIDVDELCAQIGLAESVKTVLLVHAASYLNDAEDSARVSGLLTRLSDQAADLSVPYSRVCARVAFEQGDHDLARRFLENVRVSTSNDFREHGHRKNIGGMLAGAFLVARLSERLGVDVPFEASDADLFQNKVLENVIRLGRVQGKLEMARDPTSVPVKEEVIKSCLFLALAESGEKYQSLDPLSANSLEWYAKTLVGIAALHGEATLSALEDQVERLYARDDTRLRFTPFRLAFATEIYRIDGDQEKAIARVRSLDGFIEEESSPHSAVELRVDLAMALAVIDAPDQGKAELALIHKDTCGYWLAAKKEPQYVFWNEAFERACSAVPQRAGELASGFAQFVLGLAETEGSDTGHRIAYGLIKNAARIPGHCAGIISRFIGTQLVNWADIVAAVLHGIVLERPSLAQQCFTLYGRLVVPFARDSAYVAIAPIYEKLPDTVREEAENAFVACAQMFADSSHEAAVLSCLKVATTNNNELLDRAHERSEREITQIRDEGGRERGTSSSFDENEKKLKTIESLPALINVGDGVASYGRKHIDYLYARRATDLLESASLAEIESFLHERPIVLEDAKFTIAATSRLMDLGAKGKVDELYVLAERLALTGSWSIWLGGEKIAFQKLRKKREGDASQAAGFSSIVADFSHGRASAQMVLPDLDELIDLIAPDTPWDVIWEQVQEHLSVYREYESTEPVEARADISSYEELIGHIFQTGFALLCNPLTDRLRESLLDLAAGSHGLQLFDVIAGMLVRDEEFHREVSAILWKLVDNPACKDILIKHARDLSLSNDAVVTNVARNVLHRFGVEFDMSSQDLPAFYALAVLGDEKAEKFELPAGVEPGSNFWIDDPWFWTTAIGYQIKLVSRASGLEIEAIRRRCAEFMRAAGGEDVFGPLAEKQLSINLKSLDLQFTFARLMPYYALSSLGKVIEELARAGQFDFSVFEVLWPELGGAPVSRFEISCEPRPDWIVPAALPKMDHWKIDADTWLQLGPENSFVPITDGFFVLAEQAEFAFVGNWKKLSVIRTSLPDFEWDCGPDEHLFGIEKAMGLDHLGMILKDRDLAILCTVDDPMYGDLRDATLTLSQRVLDEFGWIRSRKRPFDIHDAEGNLVAVTRMWMDGLGYPEHSFKERSGHGHVVLISNEAKKKLDVRFGKLTIKTRAIQRHESSDGKHERVFFDALQSAN